MNSVRMYRIPLLIGVWVGIMLMGIPLSEGKAPEFLIQADDVVRGDPKAPITLLEYSDFTCHFCKKFFQETFPKLLTEYIETGKVRFVYRDFPRGFGNPLRTANAARCAGEQKAYWPMHDRLFNSGGQFDPDSLKQYATELQLNSQEFSQCLASHRYMQDIEKDLQDAGALGIRGTPAFVLFPTQVPEDPNLILIPGAFPFETFKEEIDKLLNLQESSNSSPPAAASTALKGT